MIKLVKKSLTLLSAVCCVYAGGNFGAYPTFREVDSALTSLQTRFPAICGRSALAEKSFQGRDLFCVKVSSSPSAPNQRPEALISGIQHADEPIGGIMCLRDIEYLCANYGTDAEATWLVNNRQIWFVPVMNPDRYVWNESRTVITDRRRKNLRITLPATETNGGVDPNRNYPFKWGYDNVGSGSDPTASNYRGTAPLSEPETRTVVNFVAAHRIRTWQNHHNSGDYLIIPYGYAGAKKYPADSAVYFTICREQSRYYHYVKYGNSGDCYGSWILNGGTDDWGTSDSAKYGKDYKTYCVIPEIGPDPNFYWDFWNDRAKLLARCDSILGADLYMIKVAGFYPVIKQLTVQDNIIGNNDGILNPGESARLVVTIENKSVVDTTPAVTAALSTSYANVSMTDSSGSYGDVKLLSDAQNNADPFALTCQPAARQGDIVRLSLKVRWTMNSVSFEKVLPCSLAVGMPTGVAFGKAISPQDRIAVSCDTRRQVRVTLRCGAAGFSDRAVITVYSIAGTAVTTIERVVTGPQTGIVWDCSDDRGGRVPGGLYIVKVQWGATGAVTRIVVK